MHSVNKNQLPIDEPLLYVRLPSIGLYPKVTKVLAPTELEKKCLKLLLSNIQYECTGRTTCAVSRSWRTIQHNGSLYTPTFASVINKYRSFCNDSYSTSSWLPFFVSLRDSITRFFASGFFHETSSPKPLKIMSWSFQIFSKFAEIFARRGAPLVSTTLVANLPPVSTTPAEN